MRLIAIQRAHFGRSEHTNFITVRRLLKLSLKKNEVICLVSRSGDQLIFVYGIEQSVGMPPVLRSVRLRLTTGAKWNPMMLANYARAVGLTLDGVKFFEDFYKR